MLPVAPEDRWLCCLPVHHVAGLSIFTRCAIFGATVVAEPFEPNTVKALMEAGEVTIASLVPTMLLRLREAGLERAPEVRGILLGGGPIPAELLEWALDVGLPVMPTYGMTETCSQIATAEVGERLARPLPGVELKIADDGEILVRGPMVAADGWLHTGDRGRLTDDGLLEVEGRMDDVIVTGGENVAAREVEDAIRSHPAVDRCRGARDRGPGVGQGDLGVRGRRGRPRKSSSSTAVPACPASRSPSASSSSASCRAPRPGRSGARR